MKIKLKMSYYVIMQLGLGRLATLESSKLKSKVFYAKIIANLGFRIEEAESEFRYLLLLSFLNWCIATVTYTYKLFFVHVAFLRAQTQNFRNESAFN